jgi:hypothetical protein
MKHHRRTNVGNVDLNRNFIGDENFFRVKAASYNPIYTKIVPLINPQGTIHSKVDFLVRQCAFYLKILKYIMAFGINRLRSATLLGQYKFPQGIYYGGDKVEEEIQTVIQLLRRSFEPYHRIVLLDMHTGYGNRYQMTVVNSYLEAAASEEMVQRFGYPRVVKSNPSEFYSIQGDMIDYIYSHIQSESQPKHIYATSFEFGTLGHQFSAGLKSLRAMVFENQLYWCGAHGTGVAAQIRDDFLELYYPQEARWRLKAIQDARQAALGILRAEAYIP